MIAGQCELNISRHYLFELKIPLNHCSTHGSSSHFFTLKGDASGQINYLPLFEYVQYESSNNMVNF